MLMFFRRAFALFTAIWMAIPGAFPKEKALRPSTDALKPTDRERAIQLAESYYTQYFSPALSRLSLYPFSFESATCWEAIGLLSLSKRLTLLDACYEKELCQAVRTVQKYRKEIAGVFAGYVVPWKPLRSQTNQENGIAYDDNMWLGRDFAALFEETGEAQYRTYAMEIGEFLLSEAWVTLPAQLFADKGWPLPDGDVIGFYWDNRHDAVHTCSTGPAAQFFAALYRITGEAKYLEAAQKTYRMLPYLENSDGTFHDLVRFVRDEDRNITAFDSHDRAVYTYNSGSPITAAVELYKATGEESYLDDARHWAERADASFAKPGSVPGVWDYPDQNIWFHLILMNGYTALLPYESAAADYIARFRSGLDYAYASHRTQGKLGAYENLLPRDLTGGFPDDPGYQHLALDASAAAEIYALLALAE